MKSPSFRKVFMKGSFPGFQGNLVEWEVSFSGVVRVGRKGTIGTFWQTPDGVIKYRADLVEFAGKTVVKWYGGFDLGVRKVETLGNGDSIMQLSLTMGSKVGNVSLEGKITTDSQGGLTFTASHKTDTTVFTLPDGTELTVRGDYQVSMRLGPDMKWVLATYAAWTLTETYLLDWIQGEAATLTQIDWENTAVTGAKVVTVAVAGYSIYKWTRYIMVIGKVLGEAILDFAEGCSGVLFIIMPKDYWDQNTTSA